MRPRLAALAALVAVLALAGALARGRQRDAQRLAAQRDAAAQVRAVASAVDVCLFGEVPAADRVALARRVALHPDTDPAWPGVCAPYARSLADAARRAPSPPAPLTRAAERATALARALDDAALPAAVRAFRDGSGGDDAVAWTPLAAALRDAERDVARAYGAASARPPRVPTPRALASVAGDVVPVYVAPGSIVAGASAAAGTLSVLFIEPTRARVFCRTRDRGVTVACRRLGDDPAAPSWLVGNDEPEALLLRPRPLATVAPADAHDAPVFTVGAPLAPGLAARVSGGALYAVADVAGAASLARCPRGAPCVQAPLGLPAAREAAVVSTGAARWWFGVAGDGALALDARRLAPDAPPGDAARVTPLASSTPLLASCHAPGVAYVAVTDGARAHLVAAEGAAAPRLLGAFEAVGLPAELVCDAEGATLVGASRARGCERRGGCAPPVALDGLFRAARVGGELVVVSTTRDGGDGLRARHGAAAGFAQARSWAVDDDAAHGGLSARDLWLFAAGDHLVLFATGATTTVLWSSDRGERWRASREPVEARPMRLGAVR